MLHYQLTPQLAGGFAKHWRFSRVIANEFHRPRVFVIASEVGHEQRIGDELHSHAIDFSEYTTRVLIL